MEKYYDVRALIGQIKSMTDLRDIVPNTVRVGNAVMRVCPFHNDTAPSMHINKEYYYCYGCGATGDIISWIEKSYNVDFQDALKMAAGYAGIDIENTLVQHQINQIVQKRNEIYQEAINYKLNLGKYPSALDYLVHTRGLSMETIEHFELGYRQDWNAISIPIHDRSGRIIAISYRFLNDKNKRYYHKNNILFQKSEVLYNMRALSIDGDAIICEGMFDAMKIHQCGYRKVLAMMGGYITDKQVALLLNSNCEKLIFVPDNKATTDFELFKKSVLRLRSVYPDIRISVAILPEGKDPADSTEEELVSAIEAAQPAELAVLTYDLSKAKDREEEYALARKIVREIKDPLVKDDIINFLANYWNKSYDVVKLSLDRGDTPQFRVISVREAIEELIQEENEAAKTNLSMGWECIAKYIQRPHTKQICVFAGRTSVGKTMWAINYIYKIKEMNIPILFVSQEQPPSEIVNRLLLIATSEPDIGKMNSRQLREAILRNDSKFIYLREYLPLAFPNLVISSSAVSPQQLKDLIVDASYFLGEAIKIVIVDYLGLMKLSQPRAMSSYERMSQIMTENQQVIKEADVLGIFLSQVGREAGGEGNEPIGIDAMRDSGVIEEVCDYIITSWVDKSSPQMEIERGMRKINGKVCKNRHGRVGDFQLYMDLETLRYHEGI